MENEHLRFLTSLRCVRNDMAVTMVHSWESRNTYPCQPVVREGWGLPRTRYGGDGEVCEHVYPLYATDFRVGTLTTQRSESLNFKPLRSREILVPGANLDSVQRTGEPC